MKWNLCATHQSTFCQSKSDLADRRTINALCVCLRELDTTFFVRLTPARWLERSCQQEYYNIARKSLVLHAVGWPDDVILQCVPGNMLMKGLCVNRWCPVANNTSEPSRQVKFILKIQIETWHCRKFCRAILSNNLNWYKLWVFFTRIERYINMQRSAQAVIIAILWTTIFIVPLIWECF